MADQGANGTGPFFQMMNPRPPEAAFVVQVIWTNFETKGRPSAFPRFQGTTSPKTVWPAVPVRTSYPSSP